MNSAGGKWWKTLALAMGLPSLILSLFFGLYALVERGLMSWDMLLILMVVLIGNTLFLMVRYGMVKKDKQ